MIALSWGRRISFEAVCVDRCAPYWTFRRHLDRPSTDGEIGFRPPWSRSPPESSHLPGCPTRQRVGTGSREVSRPFDDITRASPMCDDTVHRRRGAALRLFQPLSGLPAHPSFAALFHAADRPWGSPFRALLLARIADRSRGPLLPCSSPPWYLRCDARGLILRVRADSHAFAWFAWPSPELGRRFHRALARLPRRPGPRSPGPPRSRGFVCFEALIPSRIRTPDRRLPDDREPMLSWAFAPPEPSSDRASGPRMTRRTVTSVAELAPRRREGLPLGGG